MRFAQLSGRYAQTRTYEDSRRQAPMRIAP